MRIVVDGRDLERIQTLGHAEELHDPGRVRQPGDDGVAARRVSQRDGGLLDAAAVTVVRFLVDHRQAYVADRVRHAVECEADAQGRRGRIHPDNAGVNAERHVGGRAQDRVARRGESH